jgi:hypothetical protein
MQELVEPCVLVKETPSQPVPKRPLKAARRYKIWHQDHETLVYSDYSDVTVHAGPLA